MAIKRYTATKDNTITNSYKSNLSTRATGSNMGAADILEVFSIYGQQTTSSAELSRALVQFPIDTISSDRASGAIPASGSVNFYLRVFNARHSEQLPKDFTLNVFAVSQSWEEGSGLDMEAYSDETNDKIAGSNWINRLSSTSWYRVGGEYHSSSYIAGETMPNYTFTFDQGNEDIDLDVTAAVEEWLAEKQENYGFGLFLTSSQEAHVTASDNEVLINASGATKSYYTKRFFSRSSEFFFKKPHIEARWDSRKKDQRGQFYYSSSLAPADENLNTIYLYNYVRGQLRDIPVVGTGKVYVRIFSGSLTNSGPSGSALTLVKDDTHVQGTATTVVSGGWVETGIYTASFALTSAATPLTKLFDVWYSGDSTNTEYFTGSITPETMTDPTWNQYNQYTTKISNLKPSYEKNEKARFRVFTRPRNFSPTLYSVASKDIENTIIPSASYEVIRMVDEHTVVNNSTGSSDYHTFLSYDASGSYFDLDMTLLEPGYLYGIKFAFHVSSDWREQEEVFKFRVEDN